MRKYKKIQGATFNHGEYTLVPIRDQDKYDILKWRNEQIEILRQEKPLTQIDQEEYFKNVVDRLFEQDFPSQFLFSFLENSKLIGYGGLVHIDWIKKTAEISFLTETSRNTTKELFVNDWKEFLVLLKQIAGEYLNFSLIYTFAYDIRPALYIALHASGFSETKRIKNEVKIGSKFHDVVIHSYFMDPLELTLATEKDVDLYFKWANDQEVRKNSFQQDLINYKSHVTWFKSKISDPAYAFYLFKNRENQPVGQVRIHKSETEVVVGISVDPNFRGKGYGRKILRMACQRYFETSDTKSIYAYIKEDNKSSIAIFLNSGFELLESLKVNEANAIKLILKNE